MTDAGPLDPAFDRLVFESAHLRVGRFRATPGHPRFEDSGPAGHDLFVFPRTAVAIQHEGQPPFVAGPPIVTFYNRGQRYRRGRVSPDGDRCEWFALAPALLRGIVEDVDPAAADGPAPFRYTHGPSDAATYLAQRRFVEQCDGVSPPDTLAAEETAVGLARQVMRRAVAAWEGRGGRTDRADRRRRQRDLVEHAKAVLMRRYQEPLTLADLAAEVGATPFHLCRSFRAVTGWRLHQFRDQVRVRTALELIPRRRGDLTGLALELGYSSHSHFTEAFRRSFGVPPSALTRR